MMFKIIMIVAYWLYALVVFISSFFFVDRAPIGCTEGRKLFVIGANMMSISFGILFTAMIIKGV